MDITLFYTFAGKGSALKQSQRTLNDDSRLSTAYGMNIEQQLETALAADQARLQM